MLVEATTWVQSWALRTFDSSLQPSPDPRALGSSSEDMAPGEPDPREVLWACLLCRPWLLFLVLQVYGHCQVCQARLDLLTGELLVSSPTPPRMPVT